MSEPPDRVQYWVFPAHREGRPEGEPVGPFYSTAEAIDHLLPGGVAVVQVAISGAWLGPNAAWPILPHVDEDERREMTTTGEPELSPLRWHYGPTDADPNPGSMWCCDCGAEVWFIKAGPDDTSAICRGCGRVEPD